LLFESTGVSLQNITGFALSIGPGSFTGLRIGLSTVKGLAYGWQIPVVGVSTLFAHAARVTDYEGLICALLDARKNEVYAAVFRKTADIVNRVTEDVVASAANVVEMVRGLQRGSPCLFVGDGAVVYKHLFLELPGVCLPETTNYPTVAAAVARLGEDRFRSNRVDDLGALTPAYVRPSEAEFKRGSSL
jgi:tRNA threonylcarbamoyladenosine biosynthesis protein TsaB